MGLLSIPIISIGIIMGNNHMGTPGGKTICFQYPLFPLTVVMIKVKIAITIVTATFPVTFAPPGKNGSNPERLMIKIKKNIVNK